MQCSSVCLFDRCILLSVNTYIFINLLYQRSSSDHGFSLLAIRVMTEQLSILLMVAREILRDETICCALSKVQ